MSQDQPNIWARRLQSIRKQKGISQRNLGIAAGLDPFVASTRINRYEKGVHTPDLMISQKIAAVLDIPAALLYVEDDELAELISRYHKLDKEKKQQLMDFLRRLD